MYTVVIAEDEPIVRMGLISLIEEEAEDFEIVGQAEDGRQALALATALTPDLIITDIRMPVMDGLTFMRRLREDGIPSSVLVVSGHGEFEYAQEAIRTGAADYLLKPINADNLIPVLAAMRDKLRREKAQIVHDSKEQLLTFKAGAKQLAAALWNLDEEAIEGGIEALRGEWPMKGASTAAGHRFERRLAGFIALLEEEFRSISGRDLPLPLAADKPFERFRERVLAAKEEIRAERNWGYGKVAQTAIAYLERHYGDPDITLTSVAEQLGMKPANLSHIFKSELSIPFSQYLIRLRMNKAIERLSGSADKVYEVSALVGFPDYAHFAKMFKRFAGCTPTEYRRKRRG